ncbi:MAG: DUF4129 domain-containing protein, partial [Thermoplasmata archaeon]|nr:DUF4129 domain-containing protein [Thermoplasmata archaeon]
DPSDDLKIIDSDYDGLMDQKEIDIGTDRFNADTDEGGVGDGFEYYYSNNPLNASDDYFLLDNDNDNLINKLERIYGTNENISDTDHGGVPDGVEVHEGYDPLNRTDDQFIDSDGDGLYDYYEYMYGTDPYNTDSDNDELSDYYEMNYYYDEDSYSHLDPNNIDTDGDSLPDDFEIAMGTDPTSKDTDGDGLDDNLELEWGSNPSLSDTDYDGISDYYEVEQYKTDPTLKDTDGDGIDDNLEDRYRTDPNMPDSDGDGISDYLEQSEYRTSPTDPDDRPGDINERVRPNPYNNPNANDNNGGSTSQPSPNEWSDNNGGSAGNGGGGGGFSWALLIIGLILVIIIAFYYVSWRKRHIDEITEVVEAAEKELTEIKDEFDDDEVRQAIFRAYKSMLRVMEKYEFTRKKWMTPREFEAIIKSALPIDKKHITNLTNIFEEARYSNHLMTEDFKAQALKSFRTIKVQLQTYNKGD